jgi:5-formyltetrahydrofolate cyclo-ligase
MPCIIMQYRRSCFIQQNKTELRAHFRQLRQSISAKDKQNAAITAAQHFSIHPLFRNSQRIACYIGIRDEFVTHPLIERIIQAGKQCYLPVLNNNKTLKFALYQKDDLLVANQYGIPEPQNVSQVIAPEMLDIVIVPLIAYDLSGTRLGTGGGYYDKTFEFKQQKRQAKPLILGLAYHAQQAEILPKEKWDIALNGVITENELLVL